MVDCGLDILFPHFFDCTISGQSYPVLECVSLCEHNRLWHWRSSLHQSLLSTVHEVFHRQSSCMCVSWLSKAYLSSPIEDYFSVWPHIPRFERSTKNFSCSFCSRTICLYVWSQEDPRRNRTYAHSSAEILKLSIRCVGPLRVGNAVGHRENSFTTLFNRFISTSKLMF